MSVSFLTPTRTVLLVADEALYIYSTGPKGVRFVETIPWNTENFEKNVAGIIAKDCGRKPVLVLNDMVEQHYRKERIIKTGVGVLDKQGMVKRKLSITFPNYPVKAALPLKEKLSRTDSAPAADIYIFAAVPASPQFNHAMAAANESLASIAGFCLLPVESSDMIKTLAGKISKDKRDKAKWAVFMGQHKNGGLRQVVVKNGELALTRMTPIIDDDSNPDLWAAEVHQEFKATMSYLARFGYQPQDGLDVIMIANPSAGQSLQTLINEECNYSALTVLEAAKLLGVSVGRPDDLRYADPLHVAWAGRKSKFILPMKATQIEKVSQPRQVALAASLLLFCSLAFLGYQLMDQFQSLSNLGSDIDDSRRQRAQLDVQYQREIQRKEELGFDVRLVQSSIAVIEELKRREINTLGLFQAVGQALGNDLRIDKILVKKSEQPKFIGAFLTGTETRKPLFEATMQMTYPSTTNIDAGNDEVRSLRTRLADRLPGYGVEVTKFLKDYEYVEEIVVETGDLDRKNVQQDFVTEIKITGPLPQDEEGQL